MNEHKYNIMKKPQSRFTMAGDGGCCSICQTDIHTHSLDEEHLQLSECTHRFHVDCLDAWTHSDHPAHHTCPLCRVSTETQCILLSESVKDRVRRRLEFL